MYKVYILYSRNFDKLYIGCTSNLHNRLLAHNELGIKDWTRSYRPWVLIHIELFETKREAMNTEKELKGGKGRLWLRKEILHIYF